MSEESLEEELGISYPSLSLSDGSSQVWLRRGFYLGREEGLRCEKVQRGGGAEGRRMFTGSQDHPGLHPAGYPPPRSAQMCCPGVRNRGQGILRAILRN